MECVYGKTDGGGYMNWGVLGRPWLRWKRLSWAEEAILVLLALVALKVGLSAWIVVPFVLVAVYLPDFMEIYRRAHGRDE